MSDDTQSERARVFLAALDDAVNALWGMTVSDTVLTFQGTYIDPLVFGRRCARVVAANAERMVKETSDD